MTSIEWVKSADGSQGKSWNPVVGCSVVSPGCTNCYAMRMAARLEAIGVEHYKGLTQPSKAGPVWAGKVALASEDALIAPLKRKKATTWFVNSMGDLFHEDVPDEWIDRVFAVMALCPQHVFQVLTKRTERMRAYCSEKRTGTRVLEASAKIDTRLARNLFPFPNVWLGVSCEDQKRYDERKRHLRATPAAVRFFSFEPLLGPIVADYLADWAICGGESGPGARPMHPEWTKSLRDQCVAAGVPFHFKQWGQFTSAKGLPGSIPIAHVFDDGYQMVSVGKKCAGRILDGRTWDQMPSSQISG